MTKSNTKRAMLSSVLAMIICLAMLVGTTFAWFTDTASTGINKIQSGKLDIVLEMKDADGNWVNAEGKTLNFMKAAGHENEEILWEPGCTYELPAIRVRNNGNLALKYQIFVNGVEGDAKLLEAIEWTYDGMPKTGELSGYGWLKPNESTGAITISGHMKELAGNEYQGLTIDGISITVYATQKTSEYDSFDNTYDADASWIGNTAQPEVSYSANPNTMTYKISNGAELAWLAEFVNSGEAYTNADWTSHIVKITLTNDIDLNNVPWTPIGTGKYSFKWSFDGQGHTIYNLNVDTDSYSALFGCAGIASIENVNVKNATVNSNHYAAVILANGVCVDIKNCNVEDATITCVPELLADGTYDNGDKAGAIFGYLSAEPTSEVENCTAKNVSVTAFRDLGGIGGMFNGTDSITNISAENVTLNYVKAMGTMKDGAVNKNANKLIGRTSLNVDGNDAVTPETISVISTAEELLALSNKSVEGTYALTADINLDGASIQAIGAKYGKKLTIVGNGHTISNANVVAGTHNGMDNYGLFYAYTNSTLTISDLTIDGVKVETTADNYNAAVVVGYADGGSNVVLNNVDVRNSTVNNAQGGGAAIYLAYATGNVTLTDCNIADDCSVYSTSTSSKTGAYVGTANTSGCTVKIANCTNGTTAPVVGRNINGTATIIIDGNQTDAYDYAY